MRLLEKIPNISRLRTLEERAQLFRPVGSYALQAFSEAYEDIRETLSPMLNESEGVTEFDVTAFYSKRRPGLSKMAKMTLKVLNLAAYTAAAIKADGLVVYHQGQILQDQDLAPVSPELKLNFTPDCQSFCVWESRPQALKGASSRPHRLASKMAGVFYEDFVIRKYAINTGVSGEPEDIAIDGIDASGPVIAPEATRLEPISNI